MSENRRIDLSFRELKGLYSKNQLFVGIRNEDDLQYLMNIGFEKNIRLESLNYPIDHENGYIWICNGYIWICNLGYSKEKYHHDDPYITIEELKDKKDEGLAFVNKMLEIIEEYEHR